MTPIKRATVPQGIKTQGDQKGTRSGVLALPIRGCPRNCNRQADGRNTTGKPGRWPKAKTREPGNLPSQRRYPSRCAGRSSGRGNPTSVGRSGSVGNGTEG